MNIEPGPDAHRYWRAAAGELVPRPFHLRWLLPRLCRHNPDAWWAAWFTGWGLMAVGMLGWRFAVGDGWAVALGSAGLLLALPGILGPKATIPIGVDIPATGVTLVGVAVFALGHPVQQAVGVVLIGVAAAIRESSPIWAALWLWNPAPLIALAVPVVAHKALKQGPDPLGPRFQEIADHPVRTALEHHRGRWRDAWLMVAPWGACLAALYAPDWRLVVVLVAAYALLLVATDTVRLVQHAAGPVMAVGAAQVIPVEWLLLAVVAHVVWWRVPERV